MTDPRVPGVLAMLERHRPSTGAEAEHRDLILRVAGSVPEALSPTWYDPGHVTASAFVLHPGEPAVVMVEHRKLRRWLQPGGHIEPGDSDVVAAARREVIEETGLRSLVHIGLIDVDVHTFPARGSQPEHLHLDVRQAFVAEDPALEVSDESTAVRWVPFEEATTMEESLARPVERLATMIETGALRH